MFYLSYFTTLRINSITSTLYMKKLKLKNGLYKLCNKRQRESLNQVFLTPKLRLLVSLVTV